MKVAFAGTSHAARHLARAAQEKGFELVIPANAELIFISEDTPTDEKGRRDLPVIAGLLKTILHQLDRLSAPVVLTSAVPPGFCREMSGSLSRSFWHQAEILRIIDADHRARHPEQFIIGSLTGKESMPVAYAKYLAAWGCPILRMTYEEAEFAKLAINICLASQVDVTNRLATAAAKVGADWNVVKQALMNDRRIGAYSYLDPGRWQNSTHLMRDDLTLREIET